MCVGGGPKNMLVLSAGAYEMGRFGEILEITFTKNTHSQFRYN